MTKSKLLVKVKTPEETWRLPVSDPDRQIKVDSEFLRITDDDGDKLVVPLPKLDCYFIQKSDE